MLAYIQNLKLTFYVLSKSIKSNKSIRTAIDITGSSTALAGTIMATTASSPNVQDIGKILPSVEFDEKLSQEEADKYFNDPKVIKKYKLKVN